MEVESNIYYTPEFEELFVGYECEFSSCIGALKINNTDDIRKGKIESADICWLGTYQYDEDFPEFIRTKYLDKEDIESFGWNLKIENKELRIYEYKDKILCYFIPFSLIGISSKESGDLYKGQCKSINELKKLMQWLGIK